MYRTELEVGPYFLRRYRLSDVDVLYEAARESITELHAWMPWCHPNYSKKDSRDWINYCAEAWDQKSEFSFGVFDSADRVLGGCGLNTFDWVNLRANLGYWTRTSSARRGIATAATGALRSFGFTDLKLNRMEIIAAVDNKASQRVAEKAGGFREGVALKRLHLHGTTHDAVVYSLTDSSY